MLQTALADPQELRATVAAQGPREAFGLRDYSLGTLFASTGFAVRAHIPAVSNLVGVVPLRTGCWKSPRAGPHGAALMAEVPQKWGLHSTVSEGLEKSGGLC
jgi:hypothetical protein